MYVEAEAHYLPSVKHNYPFKTHLHFAHMWHHPLPGILCRDDCHESSAFQAFLRYSHGPLVTTLISQQKVVDVLHCMQCR